MKSVGRKTRRVEGMFSYEVNRAGFELLVDVALGDGPRLKVSTLVYVRAARPRQRLKTGADRLKGN